MTGSFLPNSANKFKRRSKLRSSAGSKRRSILEQTTALNPRGGSSVGASAASPNDEDSLRIYRLSSDRKMMVAGSIGHSMKSIVENRSYHSDSEHEASPPQGQATDVLRSSTVSSVGASSFDSESELNDASVFSHSTMNKGPNNNPSPKFVNINRNGSVVTFQLPSSHHDDISSTTMQRFSSSGGRGGESSFRTVSNRKTQFLESAQIIGQWTSVVGREKIIFDIVKDLSDTALKNLSKSNLADELNDVETDDFTDEVDRIAMEHIEKKYPVEPEDPTMMKILSCIIPESSDEDENVYFLSGDYVEVLCIDMVWRLQLITRVVMLPEKGWDWNSNERTEPTVRNPTYSGRTICRNIVCYRPCMNMMNTHRFVCYYYKMRSFLQWDVFYHTNLEEMLTLDQIRAPEEGLRRLFGTGPWIWQQYALLRLESKLRFQYKHAHDFENFDVTKYTRELWDLWVEDPKNKEFRRVYYDKRLGKVTQNVLIHHIMKPFDLIADAANNNSGEWDFGSVTFSVYTYCALFGTGWAIPLTILVIQIVLPVLIMFHNRTYIHNPDQLDLDAYEGKYGAGWRVQMYFFSFTCAIDASVIEETKAEERQLIVS